MTSLLTLLTNIKKCWKLKEHRHYIIAECTKLDEIELLFALTYFMNICNLSFRKRERNQKRRNQKLLIRCFWLLIITSALLLIIY